MRRESELFLARQMEDMRALQEEQRKAGLLLDDGAPVRLNVSLAGGGTKSETTPAVSGATSGVTAPVLPLVFGQGDEEEEELNARRRRQNLSKVDFAPTDSTEKVQQRLEKIRASIPKDKETLWKVKVRFDAVNEVGVSVIKSNRNIADQETLSRSLTVNLNQLSNAKSPNTLVNSKMRIWFRSLWNI